MGIKQADGVEAATLLNRLRTTQFVREIIDDEYLIIRIGPLEISIEKTDPDRAILIDAIKGYSTLADSRAEERLKELHEKI